MANLTMEMLQQALDDWERNSRQDMEYADWCAGLPHGYEQRDGEYALKWFRIPYAGYPHGMWHAPHNWDVWEKERLELAATTQHVTSPEDK